VVVEEEQKALVRKALEGIWRNDSAVFDAHPGFAETRRMVPLVLAAFSDVSLGVQQQIAEGDTVATFCLLRATHTGTFMGIAPTSKTVECQFLAMNRVAGGKVVQHNSEVGWLSVLRQLGVLPLKPRE